MRSALHVLPFIQPGAFQADESIVGAVVEADAAGEFVFEELSSEAFLLGEGEFVDEVVAPDGALELRLAVRCRVDVTTDRSGIHARFFDGEGTPLYAYAVTAQLERVADLDLTPNVTRGAWVTQRATRVALFDEAGEVVVERELALAPGHVEVVDFR